MRAPAGASGAACRGWSGSIRRVRGPVTLLAGAVAVVGGDPHVRAEALMLASWSLARALVGARKRLPAAPRRVVLTPGSPSGPATGRPSTCRRPSRWPGRRVAVASGDRAAAAWCCHGAEHARTLERRPDVALTHCGQSPRRWTRRNDSRCLQTFSRPGTAVSRPTRSSSDGVQGRREHCTREVSQTAPTTTWSPRIPSYGYYLRDRVTHGLIAPRQHSGRTASSGFLPELEQSWI